MKTAIHPTYHPKATVVCACGNTFTVGATEPELQVELCSNCHPFYTGKQKLVDTARRVDKFQKRIEAQTTAAEGKRGKKAKRTLRASKRTRKVDESAKVTGKKRPQAAA
ncbi:50S ribosomal protein L31 [Candidatus Uhrbacteria bacterium CG10_big_fil_rev_8_21_14_0_10_48_11]|uniref:Large ribosomal subunit protein bL31 n=1 Tax=Candidatus Uhrbacteria bacterium CG10_big_fil_rev_8_21_14_0_10_48_11 TaxID=1975037 RepID=A0A2M8LDV6_9BACT|nr:MAG: 50S ribosomal protein L31 [Candidatus Uhrbacteria bacterium CG10_big_fil_rev_8_21_14_0_10_48_11]